MKPTRPRPSRVAHLILHCFCAHLLLASAAQAQSFFTEVTEQVGLEKFGNHARNIVFVDYDNDGFLDVFLTENRTPFSGGPRRIGLFHNTGEGQFVDRTSLIPTHLHLGPGGAGAVFGDYDNDGDEDLFLPLWPHNLLLRNDRGAFASVDLAGDSLSTDGATWLDYDQDGYLDLYAANNRHDVGVWNEDGEWTAPGGTSRLLRGNGDGTFSDRTAAAGLDIEFHPVIGGSIGGPVSADFNDDGWPDLYLGILELPNRLFLNDGQGRFVDATTGELGDAGEPFSVAVGDIDNDGDLDIFQPGGAQGDSEGFRSLMLLNLGDGQFLDVTEGLGLDITKLGTNAAGSALADIDNDGDLDLIIGFSVNEGVAGNLFFLNDGSGLFADATASSGIAGYGPYVALGDYDEDGFVDLLHGSFRPSLTSLYRNNGNRHHWLRVELVGTASNRNAIGARVIATCGDLQQMREILGGVGRQQDERVAHFGLGERTQVDRLEIRWPSGQVDVLADIPADQRIRVFEGQDEYDPGELRVWPTVWEKAPPEVLAAESTIEFTVAVRPALFEPGAEVERVTADFSAVGGPAPCRWRRKRVAPLRSKPSCGQAYPRARCRCPSSSNRPPPSGPTGFGYPEPSTRSRRGIC